MTQTLLPAPPSPRPLRQLLAASVGNAVEWYDWYAYTFLAAAPASSPGTWPRCASSPLPCTSGCPRPPTSNWTADPAAYRGPPTGGRGRARGSKTFAPRAGRRQRDAYTASTNAVLRGSSAMRGPMRFIT